VVLGAAEVDEQPGKAALAAIAVSVPSMSRLVGIAASSQY
jgi:hypothetical protein